MSDCSLALKYLRNYSQQTYLQDRLLASTTFNLQMCVPIDDSFQPKTPQSRSAILTIVVTIFLVTTTKPLSGTANVICSHQKLEHILANNRELRTLALMKLTT